MHGAYAVEPYAETHHVALLPGETCDACGVEDVAQYPAPGECRTEHDAAAFEIVELTEGVFVLGGVVGGTEMREYA